MTERFVKALLTDAQLDAIAFLVDIGANTLTDRMTEGKVDRQQWRTIEAARTGIDTMRESWSSAGPFGNQ